MSQAGNFPAGDVVACQERRQYQVNGIGLGRPETTRSGENRNIEPAGMICGHQAAAVKGRAQDRNAHAEKAADKPVIPIRPNASPR